MKDEYMQMIGMNVLTKVPVLQTFAPKPLVSLDFHTVTDTRSHLDISAVFFFVLNKDN